MSFCKAIVVVDEQIRPSNYKEVLEKFLNSFDISKDILISYGVLDVLDHSSPSVNSGSKIGIDLTKRFKREEKREKICFKDGEENLKNLIIKSGVEVIKVREGDRGKSNRIALFSVNKNFSAKEFAERIFKIEEKLNFNILILFDKEIDLNDNSLCLWKIFNNVDPKRDIVIKDKKCLIDACKKGAVDGHFREWPDEMVFNC